MRIMMITLVMRSSDDDVITITSHCVVTVVITVLYVLFRRWVPVMCITMRTSKEVMEAPQTTSKLPS